MKNIIKILSEHISPVIVFILMFGIIIFLGSRQSNQYERIELENVKQNQENMALSSDLKETKEKLTAISNSRQKLTTTEIVKQWAPRVVYIICSWNYSDGTFYSAATGSGFLTEYRDGSVAVMTNKHVILDQDKYAPEYCTTSFSNGEKNKTYWDKGSGGWSDKYDLGMIAPTGLTEATKNIARTNTDAYCRNKLDIGEEIVVLGYPGIGGNKNATVTTGSISGYDGDYYVTDAKIDHGDSGGIAISKRENCVAGMVTFTVSGKIESMGRILSSEIISK